MSTEKNIYQLEVKLPSINDEVRTQVVNLKGLNQVFIETYSNFPTTGKQDMLYVATDTLSAYIWINDNYVKVGSGLSLFDTIDGGDETDENWGIIM